MSLLENGLEICTCRKAKCIRYGKCADCIEHHKKSLPACKREKNKTKNK